MRGREAPGSPMAAAGTVVAARLRAARDARQGILLSVVVLLVFVLAAIAGNAFVAVIAFFIGILSLPLSFVSLGADSDVEGDAMYGARLPLASLWNRNRLGAFHASDIVAVEISKDQGYITQGRSIGRGRWLARTYLVVRPRSGAAARFLLSSSWGSSWDSSPPMESSRAMDWLRERGVPIARGDAARDRRKSVTYARQALGAGVVGTALTLVAGATVGINVRGVTSMLVAAPGFLALLGLGTGFYFLADGSRVSDNGLYSYYIPVRALWNSSEIGLIGPERVIRAKVNTKKARRRRTVGPAVVLTIWARGVGRARFNSEDDAEAFQSAVDWLRNRGIPVDNLAGT